MGGNVGRDLGNDVLGRSSWWSRYGRCGRRRFDFKRRGNPEGIPPPFFVGCKPAGWIHRWCFYPGGRLQHSDTGFDRVVEVSERHVHPRRVSSCSSQRGASRPSDTD